MAENTRTLRRRIKSITSTKKITKAMQLVSAAKMRRASASAVSARPYALTAWALIEHLAGQGDAQVHSLLAQRPVQKTAVIVLTTDRGLVGGLNAQLLRRLSNETFSGQVEYITVGKRGQDFLARQGKQLIASFPAFSARPSLQEVRPIVRLTIEAFQRGDVDRVVVAYPDFQSTLTQVPRVKQLLPLDRAAIREFLQEAGHLTADNQAETFTDMTFEPSPSAVLDLALTQLVGVQLYQACLEAAASEHAARMVAMQAATDAATDLMDDLTLALNQTRQAAITKDLTEISASRAALE